LVTIPIKVTERRRELVGYLEANLEDARRAELELASLRARIANIEGEIDGIDLAVSAYEENSPSEGEHAVSARAPRRDVRSMVLEAIKSSPAGASVKALSSNLDIQPSRIKAIVQHWVDHGDVTVHNDVVRVKQPEFVAGLTGVHNFTVEKPDLDRESETVREAAE
jgi:hypothetical protein